MDKFSKEKILEKLKIHRHTKQINIILAIFLLSCLAAVLGWSLYKSSYSKKISPPETEETDMKAIPQEVKNVMKTTPPISFRVPILMYHYIEFVADKEDKIRQKLDVIPPVLALQIQTLQNGGYTFMTASELADVLDGKSQLPQKPILLTFDDGHRDFYTNALPILEKYHVKATNYVISGFLGGADFMTDKQVQAVSQSGLVEIGAHTVHHVGLKGQPLIRVLYEVKKSKADLERLIHAPVVSFAYPYGSFDNKAIEVVKDAGFRSAVSTIPGIYESNQNRYFLFRLRPGYRTGKILLNWLSQIRFSSY